MKIFYQKKGSVLLLALLVMTGVVTISLATGTLIVNEIKQSSQLDRATVAFYAAESAVERGLYQIRKQNATATAINSLTALISNSASYTIVAQDSEDVVSKTLAQDETWQLDLYEPYSLNPLNPAIKSLRFDWTGAGSWLEIRWIPWTSGGVLALNTNQGEYVSSADSPHVVNLDVAGNYLYKVRITARQAQTTNLSITAYSEVDPTVNCDPLASCQVNIPGRVKIKGIGEYPNNLAGASKQAILVSLPQIFPLSGLYDYVLFSEEEIKKEN